MQHIQQVSSYFNPLNDKFSQSVSDFKKLDGWRKTAAIAAAFFGALFTPFLLFTGGFAAFRKTVEILKPGESSTTDRTARSFEDAIPRTIEKSRPSRETPLEKLNRVSDQVLADRDTIWNEAGGSIEEFLNKIRSCYREEGLSLSDAIKIPSIRRKLCSSARIQEAVKRYELRILTSHIVENKERLYQEAQGMAGDDPRRLFFVLALLLRGIYQANGRSLREVLVDQQSKAILSHSNSLKVALAIYALMIQRESAPDDSPGAEAARRERRLHQAAQRLAREHAPQVGLVTKLGLQTVRDNPQQIKQRLRRIFLANHPDRNPDGDQDLVKAAGEVQNMLRDEVFDDYREEIERLRAQ